MTVELAITGATGRMGRELIETGNAREDVEVVLAVNRSPDVEAVDDVPVRDSAEFAAHLDEFGPDAVIDFTGPESCRRYAAACAEAGVALVVGTTGFNEQGTSDLRAASESVPVLKAPNFARGVQSLVEVVGEAVANLPGYDIEVVETHHNGKRDAPSGTAKRIVREIEDAREEAGDPLDERVHGREGDAPRSPGEIGVHALRAGDITGEHEVVIANNHEEVRLTHRAESRGVFAAGAIDAAVWLVGREPGWYDFADVLAG